MRHVIIGKGSVGTRHYNNLIRLVGNRDEIITCDPNPDCEATYQVPPPGEILRDSIVYICNPTEMHLSTLSVALAWKARAIFLEKPIAPAGIVVSPRPSIPVVVGYQYRYHPVFASLKQHPHIRYLSFYAHEALASRYDDLSACEILAAHPISTAIWLMGQPLHWEIENRGKDVSIQIQHGNLGVSQIYCNILLNPRVSTCQYVTDTHTSARLSIDRWDEMYYDEMKAWLNFLDTGEKGDLCFWDEAMLVQEVMNG